MSLWNRVAHESAARCHTSADMDCKTVHARVEHEGFSFLTITLPAFGKAFEKGLDQGRVDSSSFQGFKTPKKACLPPFLGGFTSRVFDRSSGVLLDVPDVDAILAVRQLTLMFGKILLPCSDKREAEAYKGYIQCEQEVRTNDSRLDEDDFSSFRRVSKVLFGDMFAAIDQQVFDRQTIIPRHGPGSTADKRRGNAKYLQRTWPVRLQEVFPWEEFLAPNSSFWGELSNDVNLLEPGSEMPVKVISVPKTLKTPRIIAMEPTAMMFMQQGLNTLIMDQVRENDTLRRLMDTRHQEPNQLMAKRGSSHGRLATLDLSEASDRVSNQLVREMLRDYPHLHGAVDACRSRKADVRGHGVIRLAKFASMGSALCFPFEAMVFTTLVFLGIERELNTLLDPAKVTTLAGKVRVYGDDLIVPVDYVESIVHVLTHFGAKVNMSKSFWTGKFRESCGKEYYDGQDVSIVRVRREFPTQWKDAARVMSIVSLRNQLYMAGYWGTCKWLDEEIRKVIRHFPVVSPSSRVHGRWSYLGYETQKDHPTLHHPLVKGYVEVSRSPINTLDGLDALLKFFLERGEEPIFNEDHLERSGRPAVVDIKPRWAAPF
jgi:hypothetical protein